MRCHSVGVVRPGAVGSAIDDARFRSRSHRAVIGAYHAAGNVSKRTNTLVISNNCSARQFY